MLGRQQKDRFFRFASQIRNEMPSFSTPDNGFPGQHSVFGRGWNAASHAVNAASDAASHAARAPFALVGGDGLMDKMSRGLSWLMPGRRSGWMERESVMPDWVPQMDRWSEMRMPTMRGCMSVRHKGRSGWRSGGPGLIGTIAILAAAAGVAIVGTTLLVLHEKKAREDGTASDGSPGSPRTVARGAGAASSGAKVP
jgi:hypothetical protein